MAKIYANMVRDGLKTIDQVPQNLRDQVKEILDTMGVAYDE